MKKRKKVFPATLMLIALFCFGVWCFVSGVSSQLWMTSVRTITESTHQGANALNIQFERDFRTLDRLWSIVSVSDSPQTVPDIYQAIEPDITLYSSSQPNAGDSAVAAFLENSVLEQGAAGPHINPATGELVFNIFRRGILADGSPAYLVKEYRTGEIARQFTLSFFDNAGFSHLISRDGTIIVHPEHRSDQKIFPNLFDMITEEENGPDVFSQLRTNIYEMRTGWMRVALDGAGYVCCYEPLGSNWLLVSIVSEKVISRQTANILALTIVFSIAAIVIILIIAAIFFSVKMRETEDHTRALAMALSDADKANRAKSRFLMDMSHDIRTPLNAIIGTTSIASQNTSDAVRIQDCLNKIKSSSTHLLTLISDLLDMSQLDQGKVILKEEAVQLARLYEETAGLLRRRAEDKGLTLETRPAQLKHGTVCGDAQRIRQILLNIISNAVKYTPAGGRVTLELTELNADGYGQYRFRCADTGIGIEPAFMDRLFQPFERARNTTDSKISGTGVGLAITKSLLDMMDGKVSVESEPGKGSVFTVLFRLKIQEQPAETEPPDAAGEPDIPPKETDYAGKRVLLVEDNELNMEIMEELLGLTGVQIEKAYNGREAVELIRSKPVGYYDLIFMDIQMPVMDGYEATRCIREMERKDVQDIPIFAVSANALASDVKNAMDSGMNGHIAKPVDLDILEKVLEQCLQ